MRSAEILAAAPTEQDLLIEMVRMCVAEAGYDPELIQPVDDPSSGFVFTDVYSVIPTVVCWRARELVGIGEPKCYRCTRRDCHDKRVGGCEADRRSVWDCSGRSTAGS